MNDFPQLINLILSVVLAVFSLASLASAFGDYLEGNKAECKPKIIRGITMLIMPAVFLFFFYSN